MEDNPLTMTAPFAIVRCSGSPLTLKVEVEVDRVSRRVLVAIVSPDREIDAVEAEAVSHYFGRLGHD